MNLRPLLEKNFHCKSHEQQACITHEFFKKITKKLSIYVTSNG